MSAVRQVGIKMTVDAQSVTTEVPKVAREFDNLGARAEQASARTTRSLAQVQMSVRDIVQGAAGLHIVSGGLTAISNAISAMPRNAFDFSKQLETSQIGMAGILGSMTAINGKQTDYNAALRISSEYIQKLNDDALRTAATSKELTTVFQALLAPGLSAKMSLEEIRQLTVVGTNAVKSMGLESTQVVQELRDLVSGGITPASSTLASALGLKDADIQKAKASSEGLFSFLMQRLQGFEASSAAFGDSFQGKLEQLKEGATRVAADGLEPLIAASKQAVGEISALFTTIDKAGNVQLNQQLVGGIKEYATAAAEAMQIGQQWAAVLWENRNAAMVLGAAWAGIKLGGMVSDVLAAVSAKTELAQASRLAAMQAAVEAAGNVEVVATSRQKVAAYLAELEAKAASAQADVVQQRAQLATLTMTREAIVVSRAEVVAKLEATRMTMAQAEAQIAAARAAGAQSMALALLREGTQALMAAQARHALLMTELATLGKQQASVNAAIAASTTAQTAASNAAAAAAGNLAAAQGAASVAGRALSGVSGFLGGPIGIVTTLVTLGATAWSLWGSAGSDAERKVRGEIARSTPDILADLDKQIAKLKARNTLAAAGAGDLAKQGGEAAERMGELQQTIQRLQSQKGGNQTEEVRRLDDIRKAQAEYGLLLQSVRTVQGAQTALDKGTGNLTQTLTGQEQAWRKVNDGVKTASAIQQEYESKLSASRQAWETFKAGLEKSNTDPTKVKALQAEQDQVEKSLAAERDKKIKEMGAGSASAQSHAIDAQVAAVQQGYKLLAAKTADGLDEIDSLRKQGLLSEYETSERRTALQMQDMDAQREALQAELAVVKGKKESAKEQANLLGQLAELEQKRVNLQNKATRDQIEHDGQLLDAIEKRARAEEAAARQAQQSVHLARLEGQEIGKTGAALGALRQARVEEAAKQLEAQAITQAGIDLSGDTSKALRAQAKAVRDLAQTNGYNEAARMVSDYAKAIDQSNAAALYEQSLAGMSQRDRDIALEQYRIAIDLKSRLDEIDAKNPADVEGAARLKAQAIEAATRAQVGVTARVNNAEWKRSVEQYDDIFRQGFADMLNRGEEGWKSFTKSLGTTFKTTVADQIYKTFAQPFVVKFVAQMLGLTGLSGAANAVTGGGGVLGAVQTASNLNTLWGAGSQALLGGTAGASMASLGYANAVGMVGGDAIGALATANGMWAGVATGAQAAAQSAIAANLALEAGTAAALPAGTLAAAQGTAAGAAAGGSSLSSALSAIPGWGWALAGVVALAAIFSKKATPHMGAASSYSAEGGLVSSADIYRSSGLADTRTYSAEVAGVTGGIAQNIATTLDATAKAFGKTAGYEITTAFADDTSKDGAWGALQIRLAGQSILDWRDTQTSRWAPKEFSDGEKGLAEYSAAIAASTRDALERMDLPGWANDMLAALGDAPTMEALSATVTTINAASVAMDQMGKNLAGFSDYSDDAASALVRAAGGIEGLKASASAYYDAFYSDTEKTANAARDIAAALAEVGVETPKSQAGFRALVESQVALGESGTRAVASLMGVSAQFDQMVQTANAARSALHGAVDSVASSIATMRQNAERAGAGVNTAHTAIADAYAASQGKVADAQATLADLMEQSSDATRSFAGTLTDYLASLRTGAQSGLDPATRKEMLAAELQSTAVLAQGGDAASRDRLTGVASAYLDAARTMAGSDLEYAREVARVRTTLQDVAASLPEVGAAGTAQTLEQQIADAQTAVAAAQAEQARYAQLAADTGTSILASTDLVGDEIAALRTAYDAAAAEQAAANVRLDVALAALDALGLSESIVQALAAGQTGASPGDFAVALGVSDAVILQLQDALALSDDDLLQLSAALNVSVAPQVYEALGQSLGMPSGLVADLAVALGAPAELIESLAGSLGLSPIQMQALQGALGMDADTAVALQTALGVDPAQRAAWATALGVDASQMLPLATALGWDADRAALLGTAIGLADKTVEAMHALRTLVGFDGDALDTVDALREQIGISPFARSIIDSLAGSMGIGDAALDTIDSLGSAVGLQPHMLGTLGQALGLSAEARKAIAQLSAGGPSQVDTAVQNAYAMIGRTGIGSAAHQVDQAGFDYWRGQLASGKVAMEQFLPTFLQSAADTVRQDPSNALAAHVTPYLKQLKLPGFDVGSNYIPRDMIAMVHEGERVFTAPDNRQVMALLQRGADSGNNTELLAELRALRAEFERHRPYLEAISEATQSTDDTLSTVTRRGRAMQTEAFT